MVSILCVMPATTWRRLSLRIICLSTGIIFWRVGFGRITTAFRLPNVNVIASHLWLLRHPVRDNFFLAPIARRILILTSNQRAAVQAFIQRLIPYHVWLMCLKLSQRSSN